MKTHHAFLDITPQTSHERASPLRETLPSVSRLLPQVHVGGKCVGDAADVQALVDEGVFQQVMHRTSARC